MEREDLAEVSRAEGKEEMVTVATMDINSQTATVHTTRDTADTEATKITTATALEAMAAMATTTTMATKVDLIATTAAIMAAMVAIKVNPDLNLLATATAMDGEERLCAFVML